ncbi:transposase ISSoEn1, IS5 ssgr IS903 family [Candidatus Sodalis pierantonius str. SOPE]|uniref:Transposase ISSoEn1, IS5 ssgr IS903 family n=1 Tax=Candidatus Sodalis pierantonii str. SOPE TaxID=2342 RepID=W0HJZ1_9GAMM|nr:IS5 family transposase [Candidatus Sodalis pierantonius]AHF74181.1 transposase ISSoEn1, IS5 ssgr IS903 family [Candidatus Sodalis pierantonius str. SOPE]
MAKQKFKITNWPAYNNAFRQREDLTVWLDESAIAAWTESTPPEHRGRPLHYTDMAITTVLMIKRVFNLSLRALQGFVDAIFKLMGLSLRCPDYSLVSRRAKIVDISIKTPTRGEISHLVIDGTGLRIFGEGEWKVRQHGAERRRVWRKLHLAVDSATHEIICADLSLSGTIDAQALPGLINQTHRKIREASADSAYDTHYCHDALLRKKIKPLIPPRSGAQYWPARYHERNHAVANQHLSGNNDTWKKKVGYHRRSLAETAMFRFKTLLGGHLSLHDYDAQVGEAMAMVKALNRITLLGMPNSVRIM